MSEIKQGYKQTKVGIIPEDWEVVKIKEVAKVKDGTHFSPKSTTGDFKYITSKNIKFGYLDLSDISYVSEEEHKVIYKSCPVKNGDLLLTKDGANTGNACINTLNEEFSLLSSVAFIDGFKNTLFNQFLLQQILWNKTQIRLQTEMSGQAITRLTITKIDSFNIILPPLKEQEKIADILTTWDEAITKQTELLKTKELLKIALMQKLLSGEVRFSGFSDESRKKDDNCLSSLDSEPKGLCDSIPVGWEEVRLSKIIKLQGGYAFKSEEFKKSGIPIIRISNISNSSNYMEMDDLVYYDELPNESNFLIKRNDLLIAMSGATTGKVSIYNLEEKAYLNQRVGLFKAIKPSLINYSFLTQFVFSNFFSVQLTSLLVAGAQPNISSKDIESLKIKLPSLPEQQKIAEVLSLVDDEINLLKKELEALKQQKKALMQKLLTGQVRVKV